MSLRKKNVLGKGAYGIVYQAQDKSSNQIVAVKRLFKEVNLTGIGSYREIDFLKKFSKHLNVVDIKEIRYGNPFTTPLSPLGKEYTDGQTDDTIALVMEYADMGDLDSFVKSNPPYNILQSIMMDILLAIENIHSCNVIHRDVKPNNILIFMFEYEGRKCYDAVLCDFGIAKYHCQQINNSPKIMNHMYRCPETCLKYDYAFPADLWSIGCVFFQMISHRAFIYPINTDDNSVISEILKKVRSYTDESLIKDMLNKSKFPNASQINIPKKGPKIKDLLGLSEEQIAKFEQETQSKYETFITLLIGLLQLSPERRWSVTKAIESPFFNRKRTLINERRKKYQTKQVERVIDIIPCVERNWALETLSKIYSANIIKRSDWYSHQIMFHSMDLFDRYIKSLPKPDSELIESKNAGRYLNKKEAQETFLFCVYIFVKYLVQVYEGIKIEEVIFWNKPETTESIEPYKNKFLSFELEIIEKFSGEGIFVPTLYEMINHLDRKLDRKQLKKLMEKISELPEHNGKTYKEYFLSLTENWSF